MRRWRPPRAFTPGQRRAIAGLLTLFLACLAVGLIRNPTTVGDPLPDAPPRLAELGDRIDPNVAEARLLAAIPGLGEKRAAEIVAYRERQRRGGRVAFRSAGDLLRVNGVGASIARQIEPYLSFPSPATAPAGGSH